MVSKSDLRIEKTRLQYLCRIFYELFNNEILSQNLERLPRLTSTTFVAKNKGNNIVKNGKQK
jgi:hypothetical protein